MVTPLEIIGGINTVLDLLQTIMDVADRVKSAKDKRGLSVFINSNRKEVSSLRDIVAVIKDEEALRVKTILEEVAELLDLATKLEDLLKTMENASFVSKFTHERDQKEELRGLTGDVARVKSNLMIKIQSAHVGLVTLSGKKFTVQMEKIERLDENLKRLILGFDGLQIGEILKGRESGPDGTVLLGDSDVEALGLKAEEDKPYYDGTRYIDTNMTYDQAIMINGTVGNKGFLEPKHSEIFNNIASQQSTMINASISEKTWQEVREDRRETIKLMAALGKGQFGGRLEDESKLDSTRRVREGRIEREQVRESVRQMRSNLRSSRRDRKIS